MVARKYLCSSPHPDTWDERAAALLKSLGGSKARRRRILRDTLSSLDTENLVRKDLRPGRKTHAEHAIAFYRHVLNLNEEDTVSDQGEEEKEGEEEIKSRKRHAHNRKRGVSKAEGDSVLSMDSEEFLSQHNDLCEVCSGAGELICCSTCNLVFHLKCIRPPTTRLPPDHWSCAYCVSTGIKGHAKEARTRRRAAAAAREMTRLKHELTTHGSSDSEDADGKPNTKEKKRRASSEKQPSETAGEAQEDDTEDGKRKAKRQKVDDDFSAEDDVEGIEGRPRRPRRQPTLYNPQAGAASRWQSDGVIEWKTMGHEKGASVDGSNTESSDDEEGSGQQIWCNFCEDDPSIAVCCFCACRVCFGKHDSSQLLLCDKCDDEYHIFCLDPPLTSVPNSKKWFCPSCDSSNKKEVKESPALSPKKSKRSPRKSEPVLESSPAVKTGPVRSRKNLVADTPGSANCVDSEQSVNKGPGRPKKNSVADTPNSAKSEKNTPTKRGRPRKNPVSQTDAQKPALELSESQKSDDSGVVKRPRGRPRKVVQSPQKDVKKTPIKRNDSASKASTRTGANVSMPLVTPASAAEAFDKVASLAVSGMQMSTDASKTPLSLQKSRSGRTVKRGTFHDEIDEGAQHLKTGRLCIEPLEKIASLELEGSGDSTLRGQKPSTEIDGQELGAPPSTLTQSIDEKPQAKTGAPSSLAQSQNTTTTAVSAAPISLPTPAVSSLHPAGALCTPTLTQVSTSVSQVPSNDPAPQQDSRTTKVPRRKPGARECMQISRRFGVKVIPQAYVETLEDYCTRGKVEHLIRMRERLDDHSRMLEAQLAGLEALIKEKGETDITVPAAESAGDTRTP